MRQESFPRPRTCRWTLVVAVISLAALLPMGPPSTGVAEVRANPVPNSYSLTDLENITRDQIGSAELLVKRGFATVPLPILEMEVSIEVTGILVHGVVSQAFHNPYPEVIEAVYVFPLPENAAVHEMEMWIGDRRIHSEIKEKSEAKQVYEVAKSEGRKAALLELNRPNLFTSSVANINPGQTVRVRIEYQEEVTYETGRFGLTLPLTFTPRYIPEQIGTTIDPSGVEHPLSNRVDDADRITPRFVKEGDLAVPTATLAVEIRAGFEVETIRSSSHQIEAKRWSDRWSVRPRNGPLVADRDFHLEWTLAPESAPRASVFVEPGDEESYILLMLIPPDPRSEAARADRQEEPVFDTETMFIIDISGSMDGPSIRQAKEALRIALDRMNPTDSFNLIKFNSRSASFSEAFVPATASSIERARRWVDDLQANGGTEIHSALVHGLNLVERGRSDKLQRIIFITDGAVGNESQMIETLDQRLGETRLHTLGIGHAPNRYLMREMAGHGHGLCAFISDTDGLENRVATFLRQVHRPVLSDLTLRWEGVEIEEIYPAQLPDLHEEEPLFVSAKVGFRSEFGKVILRGRSASGDHETSIPLLANADAESGVGRRWARAKVGALIDGLHRGGDEETIRSQVVVVAQEFKLVTRYTSLVAAEEFRSAQGLAKTAGVANGLPHGSTLLGGSLPSGGTSGPLQMLLGTFLVGISLLLGSVWWVRRG